MTQAQQAGRAATAEAEAPRAGTQVVNGVRLAYQTCGSGPPVLLLAPMGAPAALWNLFTVPALVAAGYSTIALDHRGVPPSEMPPAPYAITEMAADAAGIIEAVAAGPCSLMGHSLGGYIGEELARTRPELVTGLVLSASAGRPSAYLSAQLDSALALASLLDPVPPIVDAAGALPNMLTDAELQNDDAAVKAQLDGIIDGQAAAFRNPGRLGQVRAVQDWLHDPDLTRRWAEITCPTLCLAFECDINVPPRLIREAASAMPGAEYVEIAGARHAGPLTHHDEFIGVVLDFLARAAGAPA
jgi:pimeloyl-ACP methyl ester carboxylesterase